MLPRDPVVHDGIGNTTGAVTTPTAVTPPNCPPSFLPQHATRQKWKSPATKPGGTAKPAAEPGRATRLAPGVVLELDVAGAAAEHPPHAPAKHAATTKPACIVTFQAALRDSSIVRSPRATEAGRSRLWWSRASVSGALRRSRWSRATCCPRRTRCVDRHPCRHRRRLRRSGARAPHRVRSYRR